MSKEGITQTDRSSLTSGDGQSVNVVISSDGAKWVIGAFLILILMLAWTDRVSVGADLKANTAIKASENSANELRMAQYWIQQAQATCAAKGVKLPVDPFLKTLENE